MGMQDALAVAYWRSDARKLALEIVRYVDARDDRKATQGAMLLYRLLMAGYMAEWIDVTHHEMSEQEAKDAGIVLAEQLNEWLS